MKIHLLADTLQKKFSFLHHVIPTKPQLPILANILLQVEGNILQISSTDLEVGLQTRIRVETEEEGAITVPAKTFIELINSLQQEKITLETKENILTVSSQRTKSTFQTMSSEEFPKLFEEKGDMVANIRTEDIKKDLVSVVFSASTDSSRPALSGILMQKEENGLLLVATDGYRLSLRHFAVGEKGSVALQEETVLIVPARVFREILTMKEEADSVTMYVSRKNNQVLFEAGETLLIGRLIDAEFPTYEKIIPSDFSARASFDREELLKAVKICSIFARDSANIIKLSLRKEKIIVSSQTASLGENTVDVESSLSGEENEIAFNARYLVDILSNLEETDLVFEMTGPLNPGVFKIKENDSYLHLIMPIRIQQ